MVLPLDPTTLGEVLDDIRTLADATGVPEAGEALLAAAAQRIDWITAAVEGAERPRVAALEWLDPVFIGGHWVPQLIEMAGGIDVLGLPGERSETVEWEMLRASEPEVVVCMPCGYDADRAAAGSGRFPRAARHPRRPHARRGGCRRLLLATRSEARGRTRAARPCDPPGPGGSTPAGPLVPLRTRGPESIR